MVKYIDTMVSMYKTNLKIALKTYTFTYIAR